MKQTASYKEEAMYTGTLSVSTSPKEEQLVRLSSSRPFSTMMIRSLFTRNRTKNSTRTIHFLVSAKETSVVSMQQKIILSKALGNSPKEVTS